MNPASNGYGSCRYCGGGLSLLRSSKLRFPKADEFGPLLICRACDAYVRVNPVSMEPMGILANPSLRKCRKKLSNKIWRVAKSRGRTTMHRPGVSGARTAYNSIISRLQTELHLPQAELGYMDETQCKAAQALIDEGRV